MVTTSQSLRSRSSVTRAIVNLEDHPNEMEEDVIFVVQVCVNRVDVDRSSFQGQSSPWGITSSDEA